MTTIERLNAVIEYVERHIEDKIDMEAVAKIACLSAYDLQRMFMFIAELSLSDYIRKRRLTLAGNDLKYHHAKVIDVALKYGYDSPISFARAFQAFHGLTPSEAKKSKGSLKVFPRLVFQIQVKGVTDMIRSEKITVNGKEYEAAFFGEFDMSSWSEVYRKREYWRLENAYEDFKDCFQVGHVLPYNNYPPIDIKVGQVFVIDYYAKDSDRIDRRYYISCGEIWKDMECTTEIAVSLLAPLKTELLFVNGKDYSAEFFGDVYMGDWSDTYIQRSFWRLQNAYNEFKNCPKTRQVLPYNNYPPIDIKVGQMFVVDYLVKDSRAVERKYYISDGCIWQGMECTTEIIVSDIL